nr:O-antigen ligase family protein [Thermoleptolyngbya sichuanensis]
MALGLGLILYRLALDRAVVPHSLPDSTESVWSDRQPDAQNAGAEALQSVSLRLISGATLLNLLGIFCTGSRNALLLAVLQLLCFALVVARSSWKTVAAALGGLVVMVGGAAVIGIGGRSLDLATWADDPRTKLWGAAVQMVGDHPWLGWGLGNYKLVYPQYLTPDLMALTDFQDISHAHNLWLTLAVEAGIPAMLLLTLLVGRICARGVRQLLAKSLKAPERGILFGYLLGFFSSVGFALFDVPLYDSRVNVLNWVLLAGIFSFAAKKPINSLPLPQRSLAGFLSQSRADNNRQLCRCNQPKRQIHHLIRCLLVGIHAHVRLAQFLLESVYIYLQAV